MGERDICTVLCIDDEPRALRFHKRVLQDHGYSVLAADSGPLGLALLSTCRVDAVIVGYRVQLMDGVEVALSIRRKHGTSIPVLLSAGYRGELPSELRETFDACVTQGESAEALLSELQRVLRRHKSDKVPVPIETRSLMI